MRFNTISIQNMFSYQGHITFRFEKNDKPIVLIIGENGFGKTSFINSIKIGLHGLTKDILSIGSATLSKQDFILGNPLKDFSGILNRNAKREGENFCKIFLEIEDDEILKIERSFIIHSKSYIEKLAVYNEDELLIAEDEEAQDIINSKISPNMQKFFFFDGEKIQTIADFSHDEFKQMLEDVLDLNVYDQTVLDTQMLIRKINKDELDDFSLEEISKKEEEYKKKQIEIEKEENRLSKELERLKELESEFTHLTHKIKKTKSRYMEELEERKKRLLDLQDILKNLTEKFKNTIYIQLPLLLNRDLRNKVKKDVEKNYQNTISIDEKILYHKKEQFLSKIENICNISEIAKVFDEVFKAKNNDLSVTFADPVKIDLQHKSLKDIDLKILINAISDTKEKIKLLEMEIFELEKKIEANSNTLFDLQFNRLSELSEKIGSQKEKIQAIKENVEFLTRELSNLKKTIDQYSIKEYRNTLVLKKIETLQAISKVAKFIKKKIKQEKRAKLEEAINKKFQLLKKEGYEADRICLNEDFHINLIDINGNPMDILSSSSGQKQIIATAIIWGISEFIAQDIPMIIDTPLGRLDDKNQSLIIDHFYPYAASQVIILPTPSELKHPSFKNLKNSISQVFLLSNNGSATSVRPISNQNILLERVN